MHTPSFLSATALSLFLVVGAPATRAQNANITVDATKTVRVVDERVFGMNTPFWDGTFPSATSRDALTQMGTRIMRFGGGSATDEYDWSTNKDIVSGTPWAFNIDAFAVQAQALHSQAIITTNYGSGTPAAAAAYVTYANVTKGYGFKYWEIGNECYGTWEYDVQAKPHDPTTYGTRAVQYIQAMKAADPSIKIGVVAVTGEDAQANGYTATVTNPRTGLAHSGWTPVMLATMKAAGVLPDFIIYHRYDGSPGSESDSGLLQAALTWPSDAANLRQMVSDYLGSAGAAVELLVTENNSVYGSPGKQSVSLVNGLYMADSVANVMQTEFNSLVWWDFHNGQAFNTAASPINVGTSLYGWRLYGDYGIENQATNDRYPTFYVAKLLSHFARQGDTVVKTTSSDPLLSAYAVTRLDGTLSVLVINKSPTATYSTAFGITGFTPHGGGTVYSYGIPQDNAAKAGTGSADVAVTAMTGAGPSFTASFAPYSATVLDLVGPTSAPVSVSQPASQTIQSGHTVVFSFPATGGPVPTFQWYLNGAAVSGATNSTLEIRGVTAAQAGSYTCVATNASGTVTSSAATLDVVSSSNPGRLVNLSCRAEVGTGGNILIAGFVVGGPGTSGSQPVLVRGSGPALTAFGVGGVLPDPQLQIFNTAPTLLYTNTAWAGSAAVTSADAAVGAFPYTSTTSHDTALVETLPSGGYTAQVAGESGDSGDALVEVYDATPAGAYTPATPRLVNLAARVNVGTGAGSLFAGFVIKGTSAVTVLIRASGPALTQFGVTGVLPDPQLTLQSGSTVVATNDAWGGDPVLSAAASSVGAFPWTTATSHDSALLITLAPGAYTAQVVGAAGDTGDALVEVYEVP